MEHTGSIVLVVDDEPNVRKGLSLALEMEGFVVVQAGNGQEALERLKVIDRLPLVVLLDLAMPILDGQGFLAQRARNPILAKIPIIVVSGNKQDEELSKIELFLQKPIDLKRLLESINHIQATREN
jgi:CheY-like chemotaxis protein